MFLLSKSAAAISLILSEFHKQGFITEQVRLTHEQKINYVSSRLL